MIFQTIPERRGGPAARGDGRCWEFVRSLNVERVEILHCRNDAELDSNGAAPALYLVHSGAWRLRGEAGCEEVTLQPGDLAVVTRCLRHRLLHDVSRTGVAGPPSDAGERPAGPVDAVTAVLFGNQPRPADEGDEPLPWVLTAREKAFEIDAAFLSSSAALPETRLAPAVRQVIESLCRQLVWTVLNGRAAGQPGLQSGLDDEIAESVLAMEQNPEKDWTLERLAGQVQMSRSAFAQKFKEQTGKTPSQFLLESRMQRAAGLLKDRRHHLKEIARVAGYRSVSAFSTAFKRWCGQSPSEFRREAPDR